MINFIKKCFYKVVVPMWKKSMRDSTAIYFFILFCCLLATVIYFYYKPYEITDKKSPNGAITASLFVKQTELGQYPTVFIKIENSDGSEPSSQPLDHPSISIWFGRGSLDYELKWESDERLIVKNLQNPDLSWSIGVKPLLSVTPISPDNRSTK